MFGVPVNPIEKYIFYFNNKSTNRILLYNLFTFKNFIQLYIKMSLHNSLYLDVSFMVNVEGNTKNISELLIFSIASTIIYIF